MPRFSVFTPTHDSRWLGECYQSLRNQENTDWEWIIAPNGERRPDIPTEITSDDRVKVHPSNHKKIGALKRFACSQASGDIYVELDHDDQLTPNALAEIGRAAELNGPGFYFSDFVSYYPNGVSEEFLNTYGWRGYPFEFEGKPYMAQESFEPDARNLCEILYAPNHVRAWHRDAYYRAGGHDPNMAVADDHDLVCRSYLSPDPFVHIKMCLYMYRRVVDPKLSNTFVEKGADIFAGQLQNMNRHIHPLAIRWTERKNLMRIDLGGAHNRVEKFATLDMVDADIIHEVGNGPLPFPDNSVGIVRAFDFFEHVPREKFVAVMNDIYRILAPGGWIMSGTPSTDGRGAYQDPTHVNFMNENSFWYYTNRDYSKYVPEIKCRFQAVRLWTEMPGEFHRKHNIPYVFADLVALKGQRQAGLCLI